MEAVAVKQKWRLSERSDEYYRLCRINRLVFQEMQPEHDEDIFGDTWRDVWQRLYCFEHGFDHAFPDVEDKRVVLLLTAELEEQD